MSSYIETPLNANAYTPHHSPGKLCTTTLKDCFRVLIVTILWGAFFGILGYYIWMAVMWFTGTPYSLPLFPPDFVSEQFLIPAGLGAGVAFLISSFSPIYELTSPCIDCGRSRCQFCCDICLCSRLLEP